VICPKGPGDPAVEFLDGVYIYKYRPAPPTRGLLSYAWEFGYSWLRTAWLARKIWRRRPFAAMQACNPPDTYWALARLFQRRGVKFVYDQHDLNPEVFLSRFGEPKGFSAKAQYSALCWLERSTYKTADHVISTNNSYRRIAMSRGARHPKDVTVVRSGPDTVAMQAVAPDPVLRRGRAYLAVYLGIMGPQDGVDIALRALDHLVHRLRREDLHLALLGFGDCYDELVVLAEELDITDYVTFTGRVGPESIEAYLSTADVGVQPDPYSPLNDVSTMNKTMEYMSYAVPVVAFDLTETRVSAGSTARYVEPGDITGFANAIGELLDDPDRRAKMGAAARSRAVAELDWKPQRDRYVQVYDRLLRRP
jgi:glycosyltransferase involved in cell wall biosynthesis